MPIRRRYFGIKNHTLMGGVWAPNLPGHRFHVALLDQFGKIVCTTVADKPSRRDNIPDGYGFELPVPVSWLTQSDKPVSFRFLILDCGLQFPREPRYILPSKLLRGSNYQLDSVEALKARLAEDRANLTVPTGPRVLLACTHETSRTGAPLILLELLRHLRDRHGCEIVLLNLDRGSALREEFGAVTSVIIDDLGQSLRLAPAETLEWLRELRRQAPNAPVLVNSLCSVKLATACREAGFQVRSLVHEYPYSFQAEDVEAMFAASAKVIVPCDDVARSYPPAWADKIQVLPQGCYAMDREPVDHDRQREFARRFRQENRLGPDDRLVVACGSVDCRKGFDRFASLIRHHRTLSPLRGTTHFLWIGGIGNHDAFFHALHDLRQSGDIGHFHHLPEMEDPREALMLADAFLLCSRIDPFPSVVLEAFLLGKPVIGFDDGQGSADMIRATGFGCVVPGFDLDAVSGAIDDVLGDGRLRKLVEAHGPSFVANRFRFKDYADALAGWIFSGSGLPHSAPEYAPGPKGPPPVWVLGFHRSGTSGIARLLQSMGVDLAPSGSQLGPGPGNPLGHFEDLAVLEFHCGLLMRRHREFMSRWGGRRCVFLPGCEDDWSGFFPEARHLGASLSNGAALWGWKDPRTLLFLDLWGRVFPGALKILVLRHPLECFLSMLRRGSDPCFLSDPLAFFDAYSGYHQQAVRQYAENPDDWKVVRFPPSESEIESIRSFLGQRAMKDLSPIQEGQVIDHTLFHQHPVPPELHAEFRCVFPGAALAFDTFSGAAVNELPGVAPAPAEQLDWLAGALAALTGGKTDLCRELSRSRYLV